MKIGTLLSVTFATVGAFALSTPAEAQHHRGGGGSSAPSVGRGGMPSSMSHGNMPSNMSHGAIPGSSANNRNFHRGPGWDGHHRHFRGRDHVNFYFGGFGYPYYGYPYFGYPYGYAYAPYGYGYYGVPVATYTYDPQGVYNGRVVSEGGGHLSLAARVQQELAQAGYYHGAIDGIVGDGTRRAIRSYERANGLRVDGQIDDELLQTMGLG